MKKSEKIQNRIVSSLYLTIAVIGFLPLMGADTNYIFAGQISIFCAIIAVKTYFLRKEHPKDKTTTQNFTKKEAA